MTTETRCRSCGSSDLHLVLSLGKHHSNSLLTAHNFNSLNPLSRWIWFFAEICTLVQITETVRHNSYLANYLYFSSFSDTMLQHAEKAIANRLVNDRALNANSLVVEIASNDGYLLQIS